MTTVREIIYDALLMLGSVASGEAIEANLASDSLRWLNRMLASWSTDGLMVYTSTRRMFPLTIGQASYTLGTGGNLNAERPVWFNQASIIPVASAPTLEIPIEILTDLGWQDIAIKSLASSWPLMIHPRGDYPLNTIDVWPVPTVACSLVLYVPEQLTAFASVNDTVSLPPGYEEAIVPSLAARLAPMMGVPCPADVSRLAALARNTLKAQNLVPVVLQVDSSMCGGPVGPSDAAIKSKGYVCD